MLLSPSYQLLITFYHLSLSTGNQGNDGTKDWTKFCQDSRGKTWSNPFCCHFIPVAKDMTAKRIGPNFARTLAAKFGPILSAVIPYR